MLSPEQINEIHRLHLVEKWPQRRIARHLHIGRHTLAKYLDNPAPPPSHRDRASKLDAFKPAVTELLVQDPKAPAPVLLLRLQTLGYDGSITILKDYLQAVRKDDVLRRAYVRMEPSPGERFDIDWGHFGALLYNGTPSKLYAFCLVECHSRKMYLEFTHSQSFETFVRCHMHPSRPWAAVHPGRTDGRRAMKWKDEIVEEVRTAREAYAAQFDYHLERMFEDLKKKEEQNLAQRGSLKPLKPHEQRA